MRKARLKISRRRSAAYLTPRFKISERSRDTLYRAREHLLLLSHLCAARMRYDATELELNPNALLLSFHNLADDLREVIDETHWQAGAYP